MVQKEWGKATGTFRQIEVVHKTVLSSPLPSDPSASCTSAFPDKAGKLILLPLPLFTCNSILPEWLTKYNYPSKFSVDILLKRNEVSLLFQVKQLTVFIAND